MDSATSREFDQFFDFELASGSNAFSLGHLEEVEENLFAETPSHGFFPSTILPTSCNGFAMGDDATCPPSPIDACNAMDFSDHLPINVPSFWRPAAPCDYCASRQLDCFFLIENQNCCNSCTSLFRACSFSDPAARAPRGYLNTLSSVAEDAPQNIGVLTSTKPLFSLGASMNDILDDIMKKPDRTTSRFPRSITFVMRKWLDSHCNHPYPTEEEKEELKEQTGLTRNQISNWLANARRRGKVRPKRSVSPSISGKSASRPISIPGSPPSDTHRQAHLTPFERWKESPPEHEPASISAISQAAVHTQYPPAQSGTSSQSQSVVEQHRSSTSAGSAWRAPSVSSLETGRSGKSSGSLASTNGSSYSYASRSSVNSYGGRDRRRRRRTIPKTQRHNASQPPMKIFQCTFCTDTFHIKYDWTRHEKSLHLSLEKWICAPIGPVVTSSADGSTRCVYCPMLNPSQPDHAELHNHSECEERGRAARTFFRKDHLRQHLRLIHNVSLSSDMEAWRSAPDIVRSRCGFCPIENPSLFTTWQDRADHLAKHFREGARMTQWKGDWGFDPEVAAQVTNAMPPWMIGQEANSMDPFTASGATYPPRENIDVHRDNIPEGEFSLGRASRGKVSTCWEVLTVLLGQYVKAQVEVGADVSDEALQQQARLIIYGNDDPVDSTSADDDLWLTLFKQAHGIDKNGKSSSKTESASEGKSNDMGSSLVSPAPMLSLTPQDEMDEEFRQAFEDAGIFGLDLGPEIEHMDASAPGFAPSDPGQSFWSASQPAYDFSYDSTHDEFLAGR